MATGLAQIVDEVLAECRSMVNKEGAFMAPLDRDVVEGYIKRIGSALISDREWDFLFSVTETVTVIDQEGYTLGDDTNLADKLDWITIADLPAPYKSREVYEAIQAGMQPLAESWIYTKNGQDASGRPKVLIFPTPTQVMTIKYRSKVAAQDDPFGYLPPELQNYCQSMGVFHFHSNGDVKRSSYEEAQVFKDVAIKRWNPMTQRPVKGEHNEATKRQIARFNDLTTGGALYPEW